MKEKEERKRKTKTNIIFLDFDGVITVPPRWSIDINKLKLLKKIVKGTKAKIVVTSSWKVSHKTAKEFVDNVHGEEYRGFNKVLDWFFDNIYDVTDSMGCTRGAEIARWLTEHEDEVKNYIILDDDSDMLDEQIFHFVQTDYSYGITEKEVDLGIKVLNNEKPYNLISLNFILRNLLYDKFKNGNEKYDELFRKYYNLI
jgi:hypothetical protein